MNQPPNQECCEECKQMNHRPFSKDFYCLDADCPCHDTPDSTEKPKRKYSEATRSEKAVIDRYRADSTEGWEEEFDRWWNLHDDIMGGLSSNLVPDLKSFIRILLTQRDRELRERLEGMKRTGHGMVPLIDRKDQGYNQALEDTLKALDE